MVETQESLAVVGGSPIEHPHAYGTALDNDLCRSGVHHEGGRGKATTVRKIFVSKVCSSVDLVFPSPFLAIPYPKIPAARSCDYQRLRWTQLLHSASFAASFR